MLICNPPWFELEKSTELNTERETEGGEVEFVKTIIEGNATT